MIEHKYIDAYLNGDFHKEALGEHLEAFKAFVDGYDIKCLNNCVGDWEHTSSPTFSKDCHYRVKQPSHQTLDIPWNLIVEKWKYAAMDANGDVCFYDVRPTLGVSQWYSPTHWIEHTLILDIDTSHVTDWKLTLTKRPEGV